MATDRDDHDDLPDVVFVGLAFCVTVIIGVGAVIMVAYFIARF